MTCRHEWKFLGGANASCSDEDCGCSVPVHECVKCGDCDYGDTTEATQIRLACAAERRAANPYASHANFGLF